jgi:hypothetical protein
VSLCMSVYLSVCVSICLSVCVSLCLSISLFSVSVCLSVCLSAFMSMFPFIYLLLLLYIFLTVYIFICLCICPFVCLSRSISVDVITLPKWRFPPWNRRLESAPKHLFDLIFTQNVIFPTKAESSSFVSKTLLSWANPIDTFSQV